MKNIRKTIFLSAFIGTIIFISSCVKDKFNLDKVKSSNWEPSIAVPLMNSDLTVYNVLQKIDDNHVQADGEGFLSLVYEGDLVLEAHDSIVGIPIQNYNYTYSVSSAADPVALALAAAPAGTTISSPIIPTINFPTTMDFSPAVVEIYQIDFSDGDITLNLNNTFSHQVDVTISIPSLTKAGNPFSQTVTAPASSAATAVTFDITGYVGTFTSVNQYDINFDVTVTSSGSGNGTGQFDADITMGNLKYSLIQGDFKNRPVEIGVNEDVLLKIFEDATGGVFQVLNPEIRVDVTSSVGVPIEFNFDNNLVITEKATGTDEPLNFPNPADALMTIPGSTTIGGAPSETNVVYNSTQISNIEQLTNSTPKYLSFRPDYELNKGNTPTPANPNFLTDTSKIKIHGEVELPMEGYAYDYSIEDTVPFPGIEFPGEVTNVLFRSIIDNGFPIDLKFQLYFMDSNFTVLDSLYNDYDDGFMESAQVGADGKVTQSTEKIKDTEYSQERALKLDASQYIKLKAEANTLGASTSTGANSDIVKLYDYYKVNVRLSVKIDTSIEP